MLSHKFTRLFETDHRQVEPGVIIQEEGVALVYKKINGVAYVRPSTGAADEVFAGFSMTRNAPPQFLPLVIADRTVPQSGVIDLGRIPVAGQILVRLNGEAATVVADVPEANGEVQLVGSKLFFFTGTPAAGELPAVPGDQGAEVYVQAIYEPTLSEARTIIGDTPIGGLPSSVQEIIGCVIRGELATTYYDASVDWSNVIHPNLGVDGRLTVGGTGPLLKNIIVTGVPMADSGAYGALPIKINNA